VERTQYLLDRRLGGPRNLSGRCGEEKNFLPLPRIESRPSRPYSVAIPTELSRTQFFCNAQPEVRISKNSHPVIVHSGIRYETPLTSKRTELQDSLEIFHATACVQCWIAAYLFVCVTFVDAHRSVKVTCSPTDATVCMKMVECGRRFYLLATVLSVFIKNLRWMRLKLSFSDRSQEPVSYRLQSQSRIALVSQSTVRWIYTSSYTYQLTGLCGKILWLWKKSASIFQRIYTFSLPLNTESWFLVNRDVYSVDIYSFRATY
jgi:hypothetical protein